VLIESRRDDNQRGGQATLNKAYAGYCLSAKKLRIAQEERFPPEAQTLTQSCLTSDWNLSLDMPFYNSHSQTATQSDRTRAQGLLSSGGQLF
jgi:hypothetical protein